MGTGRQFADLVFEPISNGVASTCAVLRKALAALSVFIGPGAIARDIAIRLIRDELAVRGAT